MPTRGAVEEAAAQVARADPEAVAAMARGFDDAATEAGDTTTRADLADRMTAENHLVDGSEVHHAAPATRATRVAMADAGDQMSVVGRTLRVVAEDLAETKHGVGVALRALNAEYAALETGWNRLRVAAPTMTQLQVDTQAQLLRDREATALATHGATVIDLVEGYDQRLGRRTHVFADLGYGPPDPGGPPPGPPPGGSPAEVNAWWRDLGDEEQARLIREQPGLVGNLDGVPVEARDQANRSVLAGREERLRARLAELNEDLRHGFGPSHLIREREAIEEELVTVDQLTGRLESAGPRPAFLVGYEPDVGNGRGIVAVGNPDSADNVVTAVPGTYAKLGGLPGEVGRADAIADAAERADATAETAVVAWVGYDAPQSVLFEAPSTRYADAAEGELRSFQEGLRATHEEGRSHNTVLGHSYGSLVVGQTARDGTLDADALVFVGSPGVGVSEAAQLHRPPGSVYATTSDSDVIRHAHSPWLGPFASKHGRNPIDPEFGAEVFQSNPEGGHSDYWKENSMSLDAFGSIAVGQEPF